MFKEVKIFFEITDIDNEILDILKIAILLLWFTKNCVFHTFIYFYEHLPPTLKSFKGYFYSDNTLPLNDVTKIVS